MAKLTVEDLDMAGKRVLMRVDFNVPLKDGHVANDKRIRAALPTIRYVVENGGRLILMSHLGRPKGQRKTEFSLTPCVNVLSRYLGTAIEFASDCVGAPARAAVEKLSDGQVLLLENLRFHKAETANDPEFARQLADLGQVYVNDAFGTAHRAHASTVGITQFIQPCAAGFLLMKEIAFLGDMLQTPRRPFVAILGGAKISGKIDVIDHLLGKVDQLLIGGAMAFTFLRAKGLDIGTSMLEADKIDLAADLLRRGAGKIILPVDCMAARHFDIAGGRVEDLVAAPVEAMAADRAGLDIGPQTIALFKQRLSGAQTVVWNGPMGVFELDETAVGTFALADLLADMTDLGATSIIGGGDSASAAEKAGVASKITHISTGGGASLCFLEGKTLPGIAALNERG